MKRILYAMVLLPAVAHADPDACLGRLADAIVKFRGIGYEDVTSYRVELTLPEEADDEAVPLEEIWRAPRDLVLRASRDDTHRAIVRSLALYLEPLYVARVSLLDADLDSFERRVQEASDGKIECAEREGGGLVAKVPIVDPDPQLPELFREMVRFTAELDGSDRLVSLEVELDDGGGPQVVRLDARYDEPDRPQPDHATWTLPNGDRVDIATTFRREAERQVPDTRHITFPSRYDPGNTEEIFVRYGKYAIDVDVPDTVLADAGSFRYDENGLVTDR